MESHKIHVPNHQPVIYSEEMSTWPGSMLNLSGIVHCQRLPFRFQPGARGLAWRRTNLRATHDLDLVLRMVSDMQMIMEV